MSVASAAFLIDTGPLIAAFDRREPHHEWAAAQLRSLSPPLVTCEAVLSEAAFLLMRNRRSPALALRMAERGIVQIAPVMESARDAKRLEQMIERYSSVPMSFADACLVLLAERFPGAQLLTLDADFHIYRTANRRAIPLLTPAPTSAR